MTVAELAPPPAAGRRRRLPTPAWSSWSAAVVAAGVALIGALLGWRGIDLPAQLYRVTMFHRSGLTLWDPQWYGGHWALDYSIAFPPVAATIGVTLTATVSAAVAALAFDRLVIGHFGRTAWVGSLLFALGTTEQLAIGQLSFLMGEALALAACWAGVRRRWALAALLALGCSLSSPLAGAFLALAAVAWTIGGPSADRRGRAGILVGAAIPIAGIAVMFPGHGRFPFPFGDLAFELGAAVVMWALVPRRDRALRFGAALYVVATVASFVVRSPVGGNVGRLGECVAIPLGACVLWPHRRLLFVALAAPMALWQWTPVWGAVGGHNAAEASAHRAYYTPLLDFLARNADPEARVEVVPTKYHWEADYVAPTVALARGWERQLDIVDNPLFYGGPTLDAARYRDWLLAAGVRFVALPDAPLDFAASAEARLLEAGIPGVDPVWQGDHWRVFAVVGSPGLVSGPARLVRVSGSRMVLDVRGPGTIVVRVRGGPQWSVSGGPACLSPAAGVVVLETHGAGTVALHAGVVSDAAGRC